MSNTKSPSNKGVVSPETGGKCRVCGIPMVSKHVRVPEGHRRHNGNGLCNTHDYRARRYGDADADLSRTPRPRARGSEWRTADEVLEDYDMIRDQVASVAQAAERMGMTASALDRALYRAREAGDRRGLPPLTQIDRAIARGSKPKYLALLSQ